MSRAEMSKGKLSFPLNVERRVITGILLVVLGTVCFAAKSIFIKLAYDKGANPEATLLLRQLIATHCSGFSSWSIATNYLLFLKEEIC